MALMAVGSIATAVCAGCSLLPSEQVSLGTTAIQLPPSPPPPTVAVAQGNVALSAQIAGQVQSTKVQNLYFNNGGRVTQLNVQNGQSVKNGAILASLDTGDLSYQIDDANLGIQRDQLTIQQDNQQAAAQPPTDQNQANQLALQQNQDQLALQQDQTNLAALQKQLQQDEIVAPFAGVVNDVAISSGDQVQAYEVVMDISDPTSQAFTAQLDQTTASELNIGDQFALTMTAEKGQAFTGTITSVTIPTPDEIAAAEQSGNPNGIPQPQCTLAVTGFSGQPPLGATFTAVITVQSATNVLYLPTDAVHQFNGGAYVDVYANGVINEVPVTIGLQGDTDTQIATGLTAGQQVVEP